MPRIRLCGRSVPLSTDDFVISACASFVVRASWAASTAAVIATGFPACSLVSVAVPAMAIALAVFGAAVDAALAVTSARGTLSSVEARASVPRLVEVRASVFVADVALSGALLALVRGGCGAADARLAAIVSSGVLLGVAVLSVSSFALTLACASLCGGSGKLPLANARDALSKARDVASAQAALNEVMAPHAGAWADVFRCLTSALCEHAAHARDGVRVDAALLAHEHAGAEKDGPAADLFDDVGEMAAAVFEPLTALAWAPSDVTTAAVLVAHEAKSSRTPAPRRQHPQDKSLNSALARAAQLAPWVVAVNASPIFCLSWGPLASCVLLPFCGIVLAMRDALSACSAQGPGKKAHCGVHRKSVCVCEPTPCSGAPLLDCDRTATRAYLAFGGVRATLLWVGSPRTRPWVTWYAAKNPDTGELIVAVRGTLSLENALFDVIGAPVALSQLAGGADVLSSLKRAGGPCLDPTRTFVHEGFYIAAVGIAKEIRARGLLDGSSTLLPTRLVLTGHSLGAAVATLLTLFFLSDLTVETFAFAPPSAVVSPPLAAALEPFVTSVVLGDDIVPRMSARSIARTSRALLSASLRSPDTKCAISLRAALGLSQLPGHASLAPAPVLSERTSVSSASAPYAAAARAVTLASTAAEAADTSVQCSDRKRSSSNSSAGARMGDESAVCIDVAEGKGTPSAAWSKLARRMLFAGRVVFLEHDDPPPTICSSLADFLRGTTSLLACLCFSAAVRPLPVTPRWATRHEFEVAPHVPLSMRAFHDHLPHYYEKALAQAAERV
jgi:hypothetical protein